MSLSRLTPEAKQPLRLSYEILVAKTAPPQLKKEDMKTEKQQGFNNQLKQFPVTTPMAYVWVKASKQLFYLNKNISECVEIKLNSKQQSEFESLTLSLQLTIGQPKTLTSEGLKRITKITGYAPVFPLLNPNIKGVVQANVMPFLGTHLLLHPDLRSTADVCRAMRQQVKSHLATIQKLKQKVDQEDNESRRVLQAQKEKEAEELKSEEAEEQKELDNFKRQQELQALQYKLQLQEGRQKRREERQRESLEMHAQIQQQSMDQKQLKEKQTVLQQRIKLLAGFLTNVEEEKAQRSFLSGRIDIRMDENDRRLWSDYAFCLGVLSYCTWGIGFIVLVSVSIAAGAAAGPPSFPFIILSMGAGVLGTAVLPALFYAILLVHISCGGSERFDRHLLSSFSANSHSLFTNIRRDLANVPNSEVTRNDFDQATINVGEAYRLAQRDKENLEEELRRISSLISSTEAPVTTQNDRKKGSKQLASKKSVTETTPLLAQDVDDRQDNADVAINIAHESDQNNANAENSYSPRGGAARR